MEEGIMVKKKKVEKEEQVLKVVLSALEEKKAEDIRIFNVQKLVDYADHFIFCTGTSATHLQALADNVHDVLKKGKLHVKESGDKKSGWIVLDCGEIVLHCLCPAERAFYALEQLWRDADVTHHHY
jgi:ribosome-associated protein